MQQRVFVRVVAHGPQEHATRTFSVWLNVLSASVGDLKRLAASLSCSQFNGARAEETSEDVRARVLFAGAVLDDDNIKLSDVRVEKDATVLVQLKNCAWLHVQREVAPMDKDAVKCVLGDYETELMSECSHCGVLYELVQGGEGQWVVCPNASCPARVCVFCEREQDACTCGIGAGGEETSVCRGCDAMVGEEVAFCDKVECRQVDERVCGVQLDCGHRCFGARQRPCPPCLQCAGQADDVCGVCQMKLTTQPVVALSCSHVFHEDCLREQVERGMQAVQSGERIALRFATCPFGDGASCVSEDEEQGKAVEELKETLRHHILHLLLTSQAKLAKELEEEGGTGDSEATLAFGLRHFAFHMCGTCGEPYFGGLRACDEEMEEEEQEEDEEVERHVCPGCRRLECAERMHGLLGDCGILAHTEMLVWKCRFCCNPASYFCHGTTHYCMFCHSNDFSLRRQGRAAGQADRAVCNGHLDSGLQRRRRTLLGGSSHPSAGVQRPPQGRDLRRISMQLRPCPTSFALAPGDTHANGVREENETVLWCAVCHADVLPAGAATEVPKAPEEEDKSLTHPFCQICEKFCEPSSKYRCECGHYKTQHTAPLVVEPKKKATPEPKPEASVRRYTATGHRVCACGCDDYRPFAGRECGVCYHFHS